MRTVLYADPIKPKGRHLIQVSVRCVPAGVAVYEAGNWRATFKHESDAWDYAGIRASKPWRVLDSAA